MKILFRVDASASIGTGHLERCLTLANVAKRSGHMSAFAIRSPSLQTSVKITSCGHYLFPLKREPSIGQQIEPKLYHSNWLSVSQQDDACEFISFRQQFQPDWVIVDHYALDATWHRLVKPDCKNLMAIDDLGDRDFCCDVLLDQNLGASMDKFLGKVTDGCKLLLGPRFAVLRDEFRSWREISLADRGSRKIHNVLITMGGVDEKNYSLKVMKELTKSKEASKCDFTIIVGAGYAYLTELKQFILTTRLKISLLSNVNNMASVMSSADLCIGAAGTSTWERCCLGLPTITIAIAENQKKILSELKKSGVVFASELSQLCKDFGYLLSPSGAEVLDGLTLKSSQVSDGFGSSRVLNVLESRIERD